MKSILILLLMFLTILGCSTTDSIVGSDGDGNATIRNNSDYVVTCELIKISEPFTLAPGESRWVKAPELSAGFKVTFPNGASFVGFIAPGDVITITNSGVTKG